MPKYLYRCNNCNDEIEVVHPMSTLLEDCLLCGLKKSLVRVPFITNVVHKDENTSGKRVEEFIKNSREDLKEQKQELKEQKK